MIATWLIDFDDSPYWWNVGEYSIDPVGIDVVADGPTFLVGTGDRSVVLTGDDIRVRLAEGEAAFRPAQSVTNAVPLGTEAATFMALSLVTTENGTQQLVPGAGTHDVDLMRDALAPGEALSLSADIPALVLVTAGSVTGPDGAFEPGEWRTFAGDFTLTNAGTDVAVVLVAMIGPVLQLDQPTTTTTSTTTPTTTAAPTTSSTTTTTTTSTTSTTEPPTTVTTEPQTTVTVTQPPGSQPSGSEPTGSV